MIKSLRKLMIAMVSCASLMFSGCTSANQIKVQLSHTECTLSVGSGKQISIKQITYGSSLVPSTNYTYTWTSNDVDIVKVDAKGYVTAVNAGTTDVYANVSVVGRTDLIRAKCTFIVNDPNPVSVTLNKSEISVQQGKTATLVATVEHAANKNVVWNSDSSKVTVDQNGLVTVSEQAEAGSKATITATSLQDSSASASCTVTVLGITPTDIDYTIMLYMCASTLEYDSSQQRPSIGLFSEDIREILSVDLSDNVKVIIETGGTKKWSLSSSYIDGATSISNTKLQRWEVINHKIHLVETLSTNRMADQSSFQSFLEWGLNDYNADQMGVIISGHGAGVGGCIPDDNSGSDMLSTQELIDASSSALKSSVKDKFTWLGFDCCMMQCADIATVVADSYEYMVASQETEYGEGWDHDVYLKELVKNPKSTPAEFLPTIASSFVQQYHKASESEACYQTMSVLDLSKIDNFVDKFNSFVANVGYTKTDYTNYYKNAFTSSSLNTFGESVYGLVDMADFVGKISNVSSVSSDDVLTAITNLVMTNKYCSKYKTKPCGLNAFFPESNDKKYDLQVTKSDYTGDVTKLSNYQTMCLSNGNFYSSWY